jgi:hypothetical protein
MLQTADHADHVDPKSGLVRMVRVPSECSSLLRMASSMTTHSYTLQTGFTVEDMCLFAGEAWGPLGLCQMVRIQRPLFRWRAQADSAGDHQRHAVR